MTESSIVINDNYGNVAGRDIHIHNQVSWIEKNECMKNTLHHFKIFFHGIEWINAPGSKSFDTIQRYQERMNREFNLNMCRHLDISHQKDIAKMHSELMQMKNAKECTSDVIGSFRQKLNEISLNYQS